MNFVIHCQRECYWLFPEHVNRKCARDPFRSVRKIYRLQSTLGDLYYCRIYKLHIIYVFICIGRAIHETVNICFRSCATTNEQPVILVPLFSFSKKNTCTKNNGKHFSSSAGQIYYLQHLPCSSNVMRAHIHTRQHVERQNNVGQVILQ